jgi:hypothetical protein
VAFAGCVGFSFSGTLASGMVWAGLVKPWGHLYGAQGYLKKKFGEESNNS